MTNKNIDEQIEEAKLAWLLSLESTRKMVTANFPDFDKAELARMCETSNSLLKEYKRLLHKRNIYF